MNIRPIRTATDYDATLAEIALLVDARPGTPDGERLDVLTTLVEAYEAHHHPIPPPDPVEAILYHIESRGMTRRDLEPMLGSRARVSEVLNRRRPLTLTMIRRLCDGLGMSADVLVRSYDVQVAEPART